MSFIYDANVNSIHPKKCTYAPHEMCLKRVGTCKYEIDFSSVRDVTLNLYCGIVKW